MIDTGGSMDDSYDVGKSILHRYLLYKGIKKLDYLMLSHFDLDHCQGSIFLLKNMKIKNLIISKQPEESEAYKEIKSLAEKNNVNIIFVKKGDKLNIKNLKIEIINPDENFINENILNNNAIVCKISYYKLKILFTGDIEQIAEEKIVNENLEADILKVGHHGSKTSTTEEFLKKVNPKIALIGVGENVIERLENSNVKIYRTDINGEINIIANKKSYKIKTKF